MFNKQLGIIGVGKIGSALLKRFISSNTIKESDVTIFDIDESRLNERSIEFNVDKADDNISLAKSSKYILIAVLPQIIDAILQEIGSFITEKQTLISIVAGVSLNHIRKFTNKPVGLIRIMTNTPALIGAGATAISHNKNVSEEELIYVKNLFKAVGMVEELEERHLDAVTGLSGSGPAYIWVKMGLPRDVSQKLAAQTVLGSAKLLLETKKHPGELKDMVATPGGTTITAIHEIESAKLRATLIRAVEAATIKSRSLNSAKSEY